MDEVNIQQALSPGTILDSGKYKYTIVKILGVGGFGITYLATCNVKVGNVTAEIKFAIKEHFMKSCIRAEDGNDVSCSPLSKKEVEQSREDFIKEASRLQQLCVKSRNIVKVNETFVANGTAYYVMEYIDGGSPKKMSEKEAVALVRQIAEGLRYVHNDKMLHLDIKPDNILIKREKDGETYPVLIDFGLAKHFDNSGKPTSHLQAKGASAGYSPQEQYAEFTQFSPKYDIYALGAVLLYLISGKNPSSAFDVSPNQKELCDLMPAGTSENVRKTILQAMKPNKKERIGSIDEFLANLKGESRSVKTEALNQLDEQGNKNPNIPDVPGPIIPTNRNKYIIAIAIVLITVIGIIIALNINSHSDQIIEETTVDTTNVANERAYELLNNGDFEVTVNGTSFVMKPVKGGTYVMGAHDKQYTQAQAEELPKHSVTISEFFIGETEVTQDLWKAVMGDNPSSIKGNNYPVDKVSWKDCQDFINKLNNSTHLNFRLPTEAEWEFAARGGNKSQDYIFSGSDNVDEVAWYDKNSNKSIQPVKLKNPNEIGLYDMTGNVWEYCTDYWSMYDANDATNPKGPESGTEIVRRGGAITSDAKRSHSSMRGKSSKNLHAEGLGLRLVVDKPNE